MNETEPMQIPKTPFDAKIENTRTLEEKWVGKVEAARAARSRFLKEGEELFAKHEGAETGTAVKELEKLRAQYEGAAGDYLRADTMRLRARARRTALEAARERWLLQEHGIFPDQKRFPSVNGDHTSRSAMAGSTGGEAPSGAVRWWCPILK